MIYSLTGDGWKGVAGMWSCAFLTLAISILNAHIKEPQPTALDVYRGNTELKITSVDGIPADSVVVFKNK